MASLFNILTTPAHKLRAIPEHSVPISTRMVVKPKTMRFLTVQFDIKLN